MAFVKNGLYNSDNLTKRFELKINKKREKKMNVAAGLINYGQILFCSKDLIF